MTHDFSSAINPTHEAALWQREFTKQPPRRVEPRLW